MPATIRPVSISTLASYTLATLPIPNVAGRLARVADSIEGLWVDTGSEWIPIVDYVRPEWFGAETSSDPLTAPDSITAFHAARDALALRGGGTVRLAETGCYRWTAPYQPKSNVHIQGSGWTSRVFCDHGVIGAGTSYGIYIDSDVSGVAIDNVRIESFELFGRSIGSMGSPGCDIGIQFGNTSTGTRVNSNITIKGMWIHDFGSSGISGDAPLLEEQPHDHDIHVIGCKISRISLWVGNEDTSGGGGVLPAWDRSSVTRCLFEDIAQGGQDYHHSIYASRRCRDMDFTYNWFVDCGDAMHIRGTDKRNITVAYNWFVRPPVGADLPIFMFGPGTNFQVHHNHIVTDQPHTQGFQFAGISDSMIGPNYVEADDLTRVYVFANDITNVTFDPGIYHNTGATKTGIFVDIAANILHTFISDGGLIDGAGKAFLCSPIISATRIVIRNATIKNCPGDAVTFTNITDSEIIGGKFEGAEGIANTIRLTTTTRITVDGVICVPNGSTGTSLLAAVATDLTIAGCDLENDVGFSGTITRLKWANNHAGRAQLQVPDLLDAQFSGNTLKPRTTRGMTYTVSPTTAKTVRTIDTPGYHAEGFRVYLYHTNGNTTYVHNYSPTPTTGAIILTGAANLTPTAGIILQLLRVNGNWHEV